MGQIWFAWVHRDSSNGFGETQWYQASLKCFWGVKHCVSRLWQLSLGDVSKRKVEALDSHPSGSAANRNVPSLTMRAVPKLVGAYYNVKAPLGTLHRAELWMKLAPPRYWYRVTCELEEGRENLTSNVLVAGEIAQSARKWLPRPKLNLLLADADNLRRRHVTHVA